MLALACTFAPAPEDLGEQVQAGNHAQGGGREDRTGMPAIAGRAGQYELETNVIGGAPALALLAILSFAVYTLRRFAATTARVG
jgi:hypothetical protein